MAPNHLPGIKDITDGHIRALMGELCPSVRVLEVADGPHSYSNRLWRVSTDEGNLLVRVPGRTTDSEVMRGTLVASRLASEAGVPAPRFRAFAPVTSVGLPVIVQEFAPGERVDPESVSPDVLGTTLGTWVATIHAIERPVFGTVLGVADGAGWTSVAARRIDTMLEALPGDVLPASAAAVRQRFTGLLARLPARPASLTHGDLYLDNVLSRDGKPSCLLDFEHATFRDRFADFGKLTELVFERHPALEMPFLRAYRSYHPEQPDDADRMSLSLGLYALTQLHYFNTWQPDLIGFYKDRLNKWLSRDANS